MASPYYYYGKYIQQHIRNKKEGSYTLAGMSLIVFFLLGFFAVLPTIKTIIKVREEVKTLKQRSQQLTNKIESLETARYNYSSALKYKNMVDNILSTETGWGKETQYMSETTTNYSLDILSIKPSSKNRLDVEISGDYQNIKLFLDDLRNKRPNYYISSIKIGESSEKNSVVQEEKILCTVSFDILFSQAQYSAR